MLHEKEYLKLERHEYHFSNNYTVCLTTSYKNNNIMDVSDSFGNQVLSIEGKIACTQANAEAALFLADCIETYSLPDIMDFIKRGLDVWVSEGSDDNDHQ